MNDHKSQADHLDDADEALRAWALKFDRSGDMRQLAIVEGRIQGFAEMRARRGWTSRLRPYRSGGVEDFPAGIPTKDEIGDWTREAYD